MAAPVSSVIFNTREEILSADLNRLQRLSSRELQDLLRDYGRAQDGTPISGLVQKPTIAGVPATFDVDLGDGGGFTEEATGVTADDSTFQVLRWAAQTLGFVAPDLVNPRIDLIVATPATQATDNVSRNILLDPIARTVAATLVDKTENPVSGIAIVVGTPAAVPVPPAVPAGTTAVFEVYVPAAVADATSFFFLPRLWPLATRPMSENHAVLKGVRFTWPYVANADSRPVLGLDDNVVIIDGEVITFVSDLGGNVPQVVGDGNGANDPFTLVNPGPEARPYYLYVVGGRHAPQDSGNVADRQPVVIVASTIAPGLDWRPGAPITPPRGGATQAGALYVGMGFTLPGGVLSAACEMDATFTTMLGEGQQALVLAGPFGIGTPFALGQVPPFSNETKLSAVILPDPVVGLRNVNIYPNLPGLTGIEAAWVIPLIAQVTVGPVAHVQAAAPVRVPLIKDASQFRASELSGGSDVVNLYVHGFSHHVPRLDGGAGLSRT